MEKQVKLQAGKSLSKALESIIKEAVQQSSLYQNGISEKELQQHMQQLDEEEVDPALDSKKETSSKTIDSEKEKLKSGEITPDDIVDKLNTIRSGKSFKDETISAKLSEYIESLSKAEKVALLSFLKGISQVVTGEIEPEEASDPSDSPSNVEMKKDTSGGAVKKTVKPVVIKAPEKEKEKKGSSAEDTSGPTPIKPKKK
jgi:hypothetical protein